MSPLSSDHIPTGSIPAARPLRAVNASLSSIRAGLNPVLQDEACNYFRFANGQIRRQIGQGHSRAERAARRVAKRRRRHQLQFKQLLAASQRAESNILDRLRKARQLAADKAALAFLYSL